jgi:hypothetical protein
VAISAERVSTALTRKIGPLPAYAYLGVGALGLFLYRRRAGAGGVKAPPTIPGSSNYWYGGGGLGGGGEEPPASEEDYGGTPGHRWGPLRDLPPYFPPPFGRGHEREVEQCPPGHHWDWRKGCMPDGPAENTHPAGEGGRSVRKRGSAAGSGQGGRGQAFAPRGPVRAGQRMTAGRPGLRAALGMAHRAAPTTRGLIGLEGLKTGKPERERQSMPPALALRQRPAPPRITDPGSQRTGKHQVHYRG